jgi:hypothetical protein
VFSEIIVWDKPQDRSSRRCANERLCNDPQTGTNPSTLSCKKVSQ